MQLDKSLEYLNKALLIDPNNVNALFSRGACYNKIGNFEKAVDDYYLAIEKDSLILHRKPIFKNVQKILGLDNNSTNSNQTNSYIENQSKI